jgi:deoxyribonuclease-4
MAQAKNKLPPLGAHMSIAGGYFKAVEAAAEAGCEVVQLFTKNNNQWRAKPISDDDVRLFRAALAESGVRHPIAHSSYLLNLASPDKALWEKSLDGFIVEMLRAEQLGLEGVVLHPGAHVGEGEEAGIKRVCQALDEAHGQLGELTCQCWLETTAGQGTCLGWQFEELAAMLDSVRDPDRLGICFDTCHVFAAGYPLSAESDYRATMRKFQKLIGTKMIRAFHLNDSKREFGSRVDRHEHIGKGELGLDAFRNLLNDRRFRSVPMYLETPKGQEKQRSWDVVNLCELRSLSYG